jgi:hypothetical protein
MRQRRALSRGIENDAGGTEATLVTHVMASALERTTLSSGTWHTDRVLKCRYSYAPPKTRW